MFHFFGSLGSGYLFVSYGKAVDVSLYSLFTDPGSFFVHIRQPVLRAWQLLSLRSSYGLLRRLRLSGGEVCVYIHRAALAFIYLSHCKCDGCRAGHIIPCDEPHLG